jgi:uncharacterized protein (DUF58 family)
VNGLPVLPSTRLAGLLAAAGVGFLWSLELGLALNLALLALVAWDARGLLGTPVPAVERRVPGRIDLGEEAEVEVVFGDAAGRRGAPRVQRAATASGNGAAGLARPLRIQWTDDPGPGLVRRPETPHDLLVPPGGEASSTYHLLGLARGHTHMGTMHLRLAGPLGLLWRRIRVERTDPVSVQPGLQALRERRIPGMRPLREPGDHRVRNRDGGREFARLREYARGDDPRRIDWKATARRGQVIVREFEAERSQSLVLALDAGRLMTEEIEGRARLDHSLGAALLLADAARAHGDAVGVLLFADTVQAWLPPGRHALSRVADVLASVQARRVEPDYPAAFATLGRKLRRRSLVVLFTDVVDPRTSSTLLAHLSTSARRHLPVLVAIRNVAVEAVAQGAEDVAAAPARAGEGNAAAREAALQVERVYRRAAAEELMEERAVALNGVRRQGVMVADVRPDAVMAEVLARYAEVKRRGLL